MRPESTSITLRRDLSQTANEFNETSAAGRFIAPVAAPRIGVPEQAATYPIFNRENFKKPVATDRNEGAAYNRISGTFGSGDYACLEHGLEYPIDDRRRRRYASFIDSEQAATRILWYQIMMGWERRVAAAYVAAAHSNVNVATAWSTSATALPLDDIITGQEALQDKSGATFGEMSLIIPFTDYREAMSCTQVVDKVAYTYPGIQPALLQAAQFASMLGLKRVALASSAYDSTEEGIAETDTKIWTAGQIYLAVLCEPDEPWEVPSAMRTAIWTADAADIPVIEAYRAEDIRSDVIRYRDDTDEVEMAEKDLLVYRITNT